MMIDQKILICFNEPTRYYNNYIGKDTADSNEDIDLSEREFMQQIDNIKNVLSKKFVSVETLSVNRNIKAVIKKLTQYAPDAILNFVESVEGNSNMESYIAGIFELYEIPYTGNSAVTLGNCLNKVRTKQILQSHRIRMPKHYIAGINQYPSSKKLKLKFPVILKLAREDASIGISEFSVAHDYESVINRVKYLFKTYNQEVVIEEYIEGRELNVAILGDRILPISEIRFDGLPDDLPKIITYEAKWSPESVYYKNTIPKCPANLKKNVKEKVEKTAMAAFEAMDCRDYVRVDIRLNSKNVPYVIEVNPNPDISPDAGFVRSAGIAGISYNGLLINLTNMALKRRQYDTQAAI